MIKYLLLDLDDTILDFKKAEAVALDTTLREFGLEPTETVRSRYHLINKSFWEALERKEVTRQQVLVGRFRQLFDEMGIAADAEVISERYKENLGIGHYFLPGAEEAVKALSKEYDLYLMSNGTTTVQNSRLDSAGIRPYFKDIFISQQIGVNKPDREYFTRCFAKIEGFEPEKALIVGDSLTSDILGGINAGIATCWVNPAGAEPKPHIRPDYQIPSITELSKLLKTL